MKKLNGGSKVTVPATSAVAKKKAGIVKAKPEGKTAAVKAAAKPGPPKAKQANGTKAVSPKEKIKKQKLVRDSFTMPEQEYAALGEVKKLCLKAGIAVKKSELLRIGVAHIRQMNVAELKKAIDSLMPLKAGRPKKEK
jgi:hypothetical protein